MSVPLKVLFVEDSPDDVELLTRALRRGGYEPEYERVQTSLDLRVALERKGPWDIVMSDYSMPGFNALQALEIVRQHSDVPFLIVSGTIGEETAVSAMKAGANDYLMKDSLARLIPSVDRELRESAERRLRHELESQLAQAGRLEALGKLASSIAHDFNNVLTVISGTSELMLEMITERDPLREEIEEVLKAVRHGKALTDQLLSFARQKTQSAGPIDLNQVVAAMEGMLRRVVGAVNLEIELGEGLARTRLDPHQLEQVLLNLATNARDAMPEGGTLRLATRNGQDKLGRPVVLLIVSDTGAGMDAVTLQRLFEPFYTTKTKSPASGTGLGLATVYGIVTQAGGQITVESSPGQGSRFRLEFPPECHPHPSSQTGTVVLIEDDPAVRKVLERILRRAGYFACGASSAREARALLARQGDAIELLVSDIALPDENGLQLGRELLERFPGLRVLFISGSGQSLDLGAPFSERVTSLARPFLPDQLVAAVKRSLASGAARAPRAANPDSPGRPGSGGSSASSGGG